MMDDLPLAHSQIGIGIAAEPLKLRVTGVITPREAERLYMAALTGDIKALAAALPPPPRAPEPAEPPAPEVEVAQPKKGQKAKKAGPGDGAAKPPLPGAQPVAQAPPVPPPMAEWSIVDVHGDAPLALAAETGSVEAVQLLLAARVSPNVGNERDGHTALHRACAAGHAAVVVALLGGGAVAETAARDGGTALHCAAAAGQVGAIEALLPVLEEGVGEEAGNAPPPPPPPLLNLADLSEMTPLMAAAGGGSAGACALLCDRGAELEAQDENGWTALFHAVDVGAVDAAAELSRHGANQGHRSKGGYTVDKLDPAIVAALPLPPEPEPVGEEGEAEA